MRSLHSPPPNLHDLTKVEVTQCPAFAQKHFARSAKGKGIRYEQAWHKAALRKFGPCYAPSVWFKYQRKSLPGIWNYAQTDGLYFDFERGRVFLFEVKYKHTIEAYFQLLDKYIPLLRKFLDSPNWAFVPVEICYWFDKSTAFPVQVKLRPEPLLAEPSEFSVHIWRPE